jgi:hypothetical protein
LLELTSLDYTIREGNSVISDPAVQPKAFDRQAAFPELASTAEVEPAAKRRKRRKEGKSSSDSFTISSIVDSFLLRLVRLFAAERLSPPVPPDVTCPHYAGGVIDASLSGGCPPGVRCPPPGRRSTAADQPAV